MAQKLKFQSPLGTARYPHISSPDTVGKYADNKFKVKIAVPAGDPKAQAFAKVLDDFCKQVHGNKKNMHVPYVLDEDANEYVFTFKSAYAPAIFDGRGNQLPELTDADGNRIGCKTKVGGGSVIRLGGNLVEFEKGISAQIKQVQVATLNGAGASMFDNIDDGYEFDGSDASEDEEETTVETASASSALDI